MLLPIISGLLLAGGTQAYEQTLGFNSAPVVENRTIEEIHKAALSEGGVVTLWHGGDETTQADGLKTAFEAAFPGMKLNLTVDLSKYHDARIDEQLAHGSVYVDSVILQTLHDYPRWSEQGALMNYAPLGFERVHPAFKDSTSASWYGLELFFWSIFWSNDKLPGCEINSFKDFLKPELKDKLVLAYPNDDDAILFAFDLM